MKREKQHSGDYAVVAKVCEDGQRHCPSVLESEDPSSLVIVGRLDADVLNSPDVQKHTGEGEIAIVIPRKLLMQAAKALA